MSIGEHRTPELAIIEAELCQHYARYFARGGTVDTLPPGAHAVELRCVALPEVDEFAVAFVTGHGRSIPVTAKALEEMRIQAREASRYAYEVARAAGMAPYRARQKGKSAYKSMMAVQKRALKEKHAAV